MGARTGQEYIDRLAQTRPVVEFNGERIEGPIPNHPALAGVVRTFAELYDLQHDDALRNVLTYESPTTGERVGTSFLVPRTAGISSAGAPASRRGPITPWASSGARATTSTRR